VPYRQYFDFSMLVEAIHDPLLMHDYFANGFNIQFRHHSSKSWELLKGKHPPDYFFDYIFSTGFRILRKRFKNRV